MMNKQLPVAIDFHCMEEKNTMKVNGTNNCLVTNIHWNIFFCVQQKEETIQVWSSVAELSIFRELRNFISPTNILWIWTYVRPSWAKLVSLYCFIDRLLTLITSITLRIVWRPARGTGQKCLERTACLRFLPAPATRRYCKCTCVGACVCFWLDSWLDSPR